MVAVVTPWRCLTLCLLGRSLEANVQEDPTRYKLTQGISVLANVTAEGGQWAADLERWWLNNIMKSLIILGRRSFSCLSLKGLRLFSI